MKFETNEDRLQKLIDTINSVQQQHLDPEIFETTFRTYKQEWNDFSSIPNLPVYILKKYHKYINWEEVSIYHEFTIKDLAEVEDYVNWNLIPQNLSLNEEMIRTYKDRLNWHVMVMQNELQNRDINFLREFADKIDFQLWVRNKEVDEQIKAEVNKNN